MLSQATHARWDAPIKANWSRGQDAKLWVSAEIARLPKDRHQGIGYRIAIAVSLPQTFPAITSLKVKHLDCCLKFNGFVRGEDFAGVPAAARAGHP